ncbi:MAG: PAS domain-containing protein [Eubacteriales bacterium]
MAIVIINCPDCSEDIYFDDTKEFGFCMYCGKRIIMQEEADKITSLELSENAASERKNEADKVISGAEKIFDAKLSKYKAGGYHLTPFSKNIINIRDNYIKKALELDPANINAIELQKEINACVKNIVTEAENKYRESLIKYYTAEKDLLAFNKALQEIKDLYIKNLIDIDPANMTIIRLQKEIDGCAGFAAAKADNEQPEVYGEDHQGTRDRSNSADKKSAEYFDLRQRSEKKIHNKLKQLETCAALMPTEEVQKTLYELQVHQIELEMQNEALRTTQAKLDESRARYFDLYDLAPVGYITVNQQGVIEETNFTAANLLGVTRGAMVNKPVTLFILDEDQDIYYHLRKRLFETKAPQSDELRVKKADGTNLWVRMQAVTVQETSGANIGRLVISDISPHRTNMPQEK